uniref:Uncharacterized protein n=1 Tax=Oryza brachyantha TaxID=4533 RepID=J3MFD4_ORYBR
MRLLERLPMECGSLPLRLFPSMHSSINLEQFDSELIKFQSAASSLFHDKVSSSKFGNDPKNGTSPTRLLLLKSRKRTWEVFRRVGGIGPLNVLLDRINVSIFGSV